MNQYDLMSKLPTKPSKRLISRIEKDFNKNQKNYIIVRFTKTKAKCFCTKCKQNYEVSKDYAETAMTSVKIYACHKCGSIAEYIHSRRISLNGNVIKKCFPAQILKINKHGGVVQWIAEEWLKKDGTIEIDIKPLEAYFLIGKKLFKFVKYYKGFFGTPIFLKKWEIRSKSVDTLLQSSVVLPFSEKYLNGTELENAKLDLFCKVEKPYIIQYIKTYQKHKNIENLITQGYAKLVNDIFRKDCRSYYYSSRPERYIDFKQKKPYKMLGLSNKKEFEFFKQYTVDEIILFVELKKIDKSFDCKYIFLASELNARAICNEKYAKLSFNKILKYLAKQELEAENALSDCDEVINCYYYRDYIDMAETIGDIDYFPKNLIAAHDRVNERKTLIENKNQNVKIKKRYKELEKFCFSADGLFIRPAKSVYEFVKEGNKLHHCVATYIERHADGKTNIFFIRKDDEPNKPFYTLELDLTKIQVVQNRGLYNCARTDEIIKFEEEFLNFVKETIRKENKDGQNHNLRSECA